MNLPYMPGVRRVSPAGLPCDPGRVESGVRKRFRFIALLTLAVFMGGSYALCARMPGGWLGLVPRIFVVLVVPNALNLAVYGWGKDAAYLRQYAGKVAKKLLKK